MMVRVDQAWHDDRVAGVDEFGVVGLDVGAYGDDMLALNQDVAGREVGDVAIHRHNHAPLEEGAVRVMRAHV